MFCVEEDQRPRLFRDSATFTAAATSNANSECVDVTEDEVEQQNTQMALDDVVFYQ